MALSGSRWAACPSRAARARPAQIQGQAALRPPPFAVVTRACASIRTGRGRFEVNGHPTELELEGFLGGCLPRVDCRSTVRHLLSCLECRRIVADHLSPL